MFFLCFSGKDRKTIVQSVLYHLENLGLSIWYDNHQYILGDQKIIKLHDGLEKSNYVIVIFSPNFIYSSEAIMELKIIHEFYQKRKLHIFPIFYDIKAKEIPNEYKWLCEFIYNELDNKTGSLLSCYQIVCQYLLDIIKNDDIPKVENIMTKDKFINEMERAYIQVDKSNINSKITILYCIYQYIKINNTFPENITFINQTVNYLYSKTRLNIPYNFKELSIVKMCVEIALYFTS